MAKKKRKKKPPHDAIEPKGKMLPAGGGAAPKDDEGTRVDDGARHVFFSFKGELKSGVPDATETDLAGNLGLPPPADETDASEPLADAPGETQPDTTAAEHEDEAADTAEGPAAAAAPADSADATPADAIDNLSADLSAGAPPETKADSSAEAAPSAKADLSAEAPSGAEADATQTELSPGASPGKSQQLDHWGKLFIDGLKYIAAWIIYMLPVLAVLLVFGGWAFFSAMQQAAMSGNPEYFATNPDLLMPLIGTFLIGLFIALVLAIIISIIANIGIIRMARKERFGEAFNFSGIFRTIGKIGWGSYILALVVLFIVLVVFVFILALIMGIPYIGWLIYLILIPLLTIFEARYLALFTSCQWCRKRFYATLPDPYEPKNGPFESIEELALVKGITPQIFDLLRDHLTIYGTGKVNVKFASKEVLLFVHDD